MKPDIDDATSAHGSMQICKLVSNFYLNKPDPVGSTCPGIWAHISINKYLRAHTHGLAIFLPERRRESMLIWIKGLHNVLGRFGLDWWNCKQSAIRTCARKKEKVCRTLSVKFNTFQCRTPSWSRAGSLRKWYANSITRVIVGGMIPRGGIYEIDVESALSFATIMLRTVRRHSRI